MRWQTAVDFLVLAVAVYLVLRWGRTARALRVALAILALRALALLARRLDLLITGWILDLANVAALVLVLIVYQSELRHALTRLDVLAWLVPGRQAPAAQALQAISAAAFSLAQARRGALIVLVGRDSLADLVEGGVPLGGAISAEILEAIFRKVSPVHDGATVVEGDHIARVSALLPLTQCQDVARIYGTRHRAAMGLAERSDALVIVVSEERGEVSLAHDREIDRLDTPDALAQRIRELRATPGATPAGRVRQALVGDLGLKAVAVAMAAVLWSLSFVVAGSAFRSFTVPVELRNVPRDMDIAQLSANAIEAQLRGSAWILDSVSFTTVVARFDLSGLTEGSHALVVGPSTLTLPPGLVLERAVPPRISVRLVRRTGSPPRP